MSKTVDDLVKVYRDAFEGPESEREAIAAVVRALRDEFGRIMYPGDDWNRQGILEQFDQILGDAGEKVAEDPLPHLSEREKALFVAALKGDAGPTTPPATDPAPAVCDIKELVKRLRSEEWATVEREQTRNAAADALEAMAGEVERLKALLSDNSAVLEYAKVSQAATEAAEAERDRLKAALVRLTTPTNISADERIAIAQEALGGDA